MSKEKQAVLKIAGVFISTVIGAGFASGQEIVTFFIRYGRSGLLGLGVAGVLFILYGWGILSCVYKNKLKSYSEFTNQIAGRQAGRVLSWIVTAYMLLSYGVMLAGSGAILQEQFGLSYEVGVLLLSALTFLTFLTGAKGMVSVNSFLGACADGRHSVHKHYGDSTTTKDGTSEFVSAACAVVYALHSPGGKLWEGASLIPSICLLQYADSGGRSHDTGAVSSPRENALSGSAGRGRNAGRGVFSIGGCNIHKLWYNKRDRDTSFAAGGR